MAAPVERSEPASYAYKLGQQPSCSLGRDRVNSRLLEGPDSCCMRLRFEIRGRQLLPICHRIDTECHLYCDRERQMKSS
jgi:hypothetical protein